MNESSNELIWACLDGNSSPEEEGALCREILSDGGIADAFAEQARMHASLDAYFNEYDAASFAPKPIDSGLNRSVSRGRLAWAAVALLALLPLIYFTLVRKNPAGQGYRLADGKLKNSQGTNEIIEGEVLEVPANSEARIVTPDGAEALLKSGTKIIFKGKVAHARQLIELRSAGGTFNVPPGKGEFRIETPVGHVVVLGTEFSVELNPGTIDPGTFNPGTYDSGTYDPGTYDPGTIDPGVFYFFGEYASTFDLGTFNLGKYDPGTIDPGTIDPNPSEGERKMRKSATLLAVAVVFGSVEVRIGDETFTVGAGDSRVFAEAAPPVAEEAAPPVAPVAKEAAPPAKEKGDLDPNEKKLAAEFNQLYKAAISGKLTREKIGGWLQKLGINWEEGKALARKAGYTLEDRQSASQSAEEKVLNRWHGTWFSQVTINPSRWIPEGTEQNEIKEVKWILNGRFQQISNRSDNHETHETQRYDRGQKKYQKWTFDTNGNQSYWLGDWDEKSQTMTWQFEGGELKGTMTDQFLFADRSVTYETKIVIKDGEGTMLLDILAQQTRVLKK